MSYTTVVEGKTLGPPHVIQPWLLVSKDLLPVMYYCSNKSSFPTSLISWRSLENRNVDVNLTCLNYWDIAGFKTVVSVHLDFLFCRSDFGYNYMKVIEFFSFSGMCLVVKLFIVMNFFITSRFCG